MNGGMDYDYGEDTGPRVTIRNVSVTLYETVQRQYTDRDVH